MLTIAETIILVVIALFIICGTIYLLYVTSDIMYARRVEARNEATARDAELKENQR